MQAEFSTSWALCKGTPKLIYRSEMQIQDCEWLQKSINVRSRAAAGGGLRPMSGWERAQVRNQAAAAKSWLCHKLTVRLWANSFPWLNLIFPNYKMRMGSL